MGLETLLAAAEFLAVVEAQGQQQGSGQNGHYPVIQNGLRYVPVPQIAFPGPKPSSLLPRPSGGIGIGVHENALGDSLYQKIAGGSNNEPKSKFQFRGQQHREVHREAERGRRARMRECFQLLKDQLPVRNYQKVSKMSNLEILRTSASYIQTLKRTELEYEEELGRLTRQKEALQLQVLQDMPILDIESDISR